MVAREEIDMLWGDAWSATSSRGGRATLLSVATLREGGVAHQHPVGGGQNLTDPMLAILLEHLDNEALGGALQSMEGRFNRILFWAVDDRAAEDYVILECGSQESRRCAVVKNSAGFDSVHVLPVFVNLPVGGRRAEMRVHFGAGDWSAPLRIDARRGASADLAPGVRLRAEKFADGRLWLMGPRLRTASGPWLVNISDERSPSQAHPAWLGAHHAP